MQPSIPLVDLKAQYLTIKKDVDAAIQSVIDRSHFIQGEDVSLFEKEFANYIGAKHCISLNSGTDALILGIRALELNENDEIIIPDNTFIATALGVSENKLKPVLCDIDPNDFGISLDDLKRKITKKTKAIILVHLYGQPDKINEVKKIIKKTGQTIHLIEDAAQAHGAVYNEKKIGTFGLFSIFSFYPGKNLGAYGDGGAIVTNTAAIAKKIRLLREYGQRKKYYHDVIGINSRLDTIQAAVLRVKLKHLDKWNQQRTKIAHMYSQQLQDIPQIIVPKSFENRQSVYHLYVIRAKKRNALLKYLNSKNIHAMIHYPIPLHQQKALQYLGYKKGNLPVNETVSREIVSLPIYPELTKSKVTFIVNCIKEFYEKN